MMADLPEVRMDFSRPFKNTEVEYFGPFKLRVRKMSEKKWICLMTCLTVRAVRLEVEQDLSAEAMLNCLFRFIARKNHCNLIISDNRKNFMGTNNHLKEQMKGWKID